jgi:hypothetical protein
MFNSNRSLLIHGRKRTLSIATLTNVTLKTSLVFNLAHINKGLDAPTQHMPHTSIVSAYYQSLHLNLKLRHRPSSLIPFVPIG